jgi:hypothetical protein
VSHGALLEEICELEVESDRQNYNYMQQQKHNYCLHARNLSSKNTRIADIDRWAKEANCVLAAAILTLPTNSCKRMT